MTRIKCAAIRYDGMNYMLDPPTCLPCNYAFPIKVGC